MSDNGVWGDLAGAWWVAPLVVWSIVWKGIALWKTARDKALPWFIVIFIFNTVGILEILYIYVFSKMGTGTGKKQTKND